MELSNSKLMRRADSIAINERGIPSLRLMETAAGYIKDAALRLAGEGGSACVFCGGGNNGGDGMAAAYMLHDAGVKVRVTLVGDRRKLTADTGEMARRLAERKIELEDFNGCAGELERSLGGFDVIIDAMLGIGLNKPLREDSLRAVALINASCVPSIAADIPSGVEADTGRILGDAVRCVKTITFSMAKPGHFSQPGCTYCGQVEVADIGIPPDIIAGSGCGVYAVTDRTLPRRPDVSHKGDYGRLLIVGGSVGYTGAPSLCSRAAVKTGAGLVHLGVPSDIYSITAIKNDEAMPFPLASDAAGRICGAAMGAVGEKARQCDIVAVGPGLGRSDELTQLVCSLVRGCAKPMVVDADGLYALAQDISALSEAARPVVLTPHEGEFKRLGGELTGDRISDAVRFAALHDCVLVLKGHRTVTAFPDGSAWINTTGNAGLAKGGSGDVLTGIIGALMCRLPLKEAVTTAVWMHGRAGDLCAEKFGQDSMTPSDVIEMISNVTKNMVK